MYVNISLSLSLCAEVRFSKTCKNHQVSCLQPQLMFQLHSIWRTRCFLKRSSFFTDQIGSNRIKFALVCLK